LVVLVDSRSGSASELFARIMQLEKRGTVLGDRSSGSVMEARHYSEKLGTETVVFYGVSVTEFDLLLSDGKSLEHVGVTPDEVLLPAAQDLASGRDPVLARAAELFGVKMSAEEAGKIFPYEWGKQ
jgi:C-terminal processing protease CtpA/Prc